MIKLPQLACQAVTAQCLVVATLLLAPSAHGQSLAQLYPSASAYDAAFQSAKSQYEANLARAEQAKAGMRPTLNFSANAGLTHADVNAPVVNSIRKFGSQSVSLAASQPIYRPANYASAAQGELQAAQAKSALSLAEQDLIVRVAQAYFDVLGSQDSLTFVKAQKAAVAEQLAAARRNFEVGVSTITDSREAQARFDLVTAQEIAAESDLLIKRTALDQLVGQTGITPKSLALPAKLPELLPADVQAWVAQAHAQHPSIAAAELAVEIAKLETDKAQAGHKPTLDASASVTRNFSNGSATSALNADSRSANLGIALNYALFSGLATQNRIKETLQLEDKSRSDLEAIKRSIAQATRSAYYGVLSGQNQVKALEAAEASSQSALDANKLGYQVGVRINIDVLNSQSQLFQTKRDLAKARYDVLLGSLKLRQASGTLEVKDLDAVSALFQR